MGRRMFKVEASALGCRAGYPLTSKVQSWMRRVSTARLSSQRRDAERHAKKRASRKGNNFEDETDLGRDSGCHTYSDQHHSIAKRL